MKPQRETASFVLRFTHDIWQDTEGQPRVEWRGHVCRVQDGAELRFKELAEAVLFIKESLLQLTKDCVPTTDQAYQEKAMQESFKLWERFAQNYIHLIVEAIQQTAKPSGALQKQPGGAAEQVVRPWWLLPSSELTVGGADQAHLHQQMLALQSQVEALSSKVAQLEAANTQS
ncbi:MAG: hypothetical protein KJZ93_13165 [Caldilineaceae bacterium]|nr:hypothetical protein [Caldilineaceae bacterium]